MGREIFKDEHVARIEQRPLGYLSHFVVEELPSRLAEVRESASVGSLIILRDYLEGYMENFDYGILIKDGKLSPDTLSLARLDLLMLDSGIAHSSRLLQKSGILASPITPGPKFQKVLEKIVSLSGMPAHITYEDIVLNNPTLDKRVFTPGKVGESESDFYEGHLLIEKEMEKSLDHLKFVFDKSKTQPNSDLIFQHLAESQKGLRFLVEYTGRIGRDMPVSDFVYFRDYLQTHPVNGLSGPSGQFTARVPLAEVLLAGDKLGKSYQDYFQKYRQYFPVSGMKQIDHYLKKSIEEGSIVTKLMANKPTKEVRDVLDTNLNLILNFRVAHLRSTQKQLLNTISGPIEGTSGVNDSESFLRNRINNFGNIIQLIFTDN